MLKQPFRVFCRICSSKIGPIQLNLPASPILPRSYAVSLWTRRDATATHRPGSGTRKGSSRKYQPRPSADGNQSGRQFVRRRSARPVEPIAGRWKATAHALRHSNRLIRSKRFRSASGPLRPVCRAYPFVPYLGIRVIRKTRSGNPSHHCGIKR